MPVRRLGSLQQAEDSLVIDADDPRLWSRVAGLWRIADRLFPRRFPAGVHKHESLEDLNRLRDAWQAAAIRDA